MGIELTTHEVYARSDASVTGQVLKVIATKPDAVFIASAGTPAVLPQKALRERGYKGPIYQTHGVATEEFIKLGGKDVEGAVFAGEAFTIAPDLRRERSVQEADRGIYRRLQGGSQQPDAESVRCACLGRRALLGRAAPNALKAGKPGSPEFRAALRDELEKSKDVYLNNGLSNMTPTDHNGYDERSAFLIKVDGGQFRRPEVTERCKARRRVSSRRRLRDGAAFVRYRHAEVSGTASSPPAGGGGRNIPAGSTKASRGRPVAISATGPSSTNFTFAVRTRCGCSLISA